MTTTEAPNTFLYWNDPSRDKYGRTTRHLDRVHTNETGGWVGRDRGLAVVVCLPKGCEGRYLVNVRPMHTGDGALKHGDVTYHQTLKAAKAHAEANLSR